MGAGASGFGFIVIFNMALSYETGGGGYASPIPVLARYVALRLLKAATLGLLGFLRAALLL